MSNNNIEFIYKLESLQKQFNPNKMNFVKIEKICIYINNINHFNNNIVVVVDNWFDQIEENKLLKVSEKLNEIIVKFNGNYYYYYYYYCYHNYIVDFYCVLR